MNYTKRIVCLANSRKPSGRCIAGKEFDNDAAAGWIRPVSSRPGQEISEEERRYQDGRDPRVFDVVEIPMLAPVPHWHQCENHLIDPEYYWEKVGEIAKEDLEQMVDTPGALWINGYSSYYGQNDRLPATLAPGLSGSLFLIVPDQLQVVVRTEGAEFGNGRRRVRAVFNYAGTRHSLLVTDPVAERKFLAPGEGITNVTDAMLCVSLTESFHDSNCYKVVATIFSGD